jgi:hypothetical protein
MYQGIRPQFSSRCDGFRCLGAVKGVIEKAWALAPIDRPTMAEIESTMVNIVQLENKG